MSCDCVTEEIAVVKKLNQALRNVNRTLRLQLAQERGHSDTLWGEICNNKAMDALGVLWEIGKMECSPEDYQQIVEVCLEAIQYKISHEPKELAPREGGLPS